MEDRQEITLYINLTEFQEKGIILNPATSKHCHHNPSNATLPLCPSHNLTKKQVKHLFRSLCKASCLEKNSLPLFLHFMHYGTKKPTTTTTLHWLQSKALLAYFVDYFNHCILKSERTQWRAFEQIFNQKRLAIAKNDYQKTGIEPKGAKEIAKIVEEVLEVK